MIDYTFIIDAVESVVCEQVGVEREDVLGKTRKGACVKARHLSIFILHFNYRVTTRELSERYGCTKKHIFGVNAQMRNYMAYSSDYRELYEKVMESLEGIRNS